MLRAVISFAVPRSRRRRVYRSCAGSEPAPEPLKVTWWGALGFVGFLAGFIALIANRNAMPENVFVALDVLMMAPVIGLFVWLCVSNERSKKTRRQTPPPAPTATGGPDEPPAPLNPRMYSSNRR